MNLITSSQPPQQRLRDTPPHSLTQVSHFESSPVAKGKQGKGNKTPTKENHHHTYRWTQKEEKLLAETEYAWLSGENDSTWLARCYKTFSEKYLYAFTHYEAWDVLKNHEKWHGIKAVVPKIHVRTAEDIEEPNELFQGDTIPHPPGKPRLTKIQKFDSSRSTRFFNGRRCFQGSGT
nr:hypothetical protein [Tanacetum cinerariifolium]